jgi:hypothetical protein
MRQSSGRATRVSRTGLKCPARLAMLPALLSKQSSRNARARTESTANAVVDQAGGGRLSQPQEAADGENLVRY